MATDYLRNGAAGSSGVGPGIRPVSQIDLRAAAPARSDAPRTHVPLAIRRGTSVSRAP